MRDTKTYNGHTNYATWKIQLEMIGPALRDFSGMDRDGIKDYCEEMIMESSIGIGQDLAIAFLDDVDWDACEDTVREYECGCNGCNCNK